MKTNKQFIDGIYEKYNEYSKEKQNSKQKTMKKIINLAAIFIVAISLIIISNERPKESPNGSPQENLIIENGEIREAKIQLKTVENFENFYNYIKQNNKNNQYGSFADDLTLESTTNDAVSSETKQSSEYRTNTQVENVDEADVVKVDKNYIYYVSEDKVVIMNADKPENLAKVSEIDYKEQDFQPKELYVRNNKLVVIGNIYHNYTTTQKTSNVARYDMIEVENKSAIMIYDITNRQEPKEVRRIEVDGYYISSRMIDNNLYFVSNKNINSYSMLKNDVEELNAEEYKPQYKDTAVSEDEKCIDYNSIYMLEDTENTNYLMLVGLNIESNEEVNIETFLGAGQYIYASEKNMYIAINEVQYDNEYKMINSSVHLLKFALDNGKIRFQAEADVNGQVNNQFSMDENGDYFRIATTTGSLWNIDENTSNNLYVLSNKLEEVGKLTGFGKEEKIYSVRYTGEKAYVVTFKQTDPLFVIDLTTPSSPQILGELKIPGYSTYLHPYDETHLIGFGYDTKEDGTRITTSSLKMVMFDISDLNNPKELFKISIGNRYTSSQLAYNHKALLFSKEKNIIAFPIESYENRKSNSRAVIYEIDLEKGFTLKGEISHINNDYKKDVERIVYVGNTYYTLSKSLVKAADMESLQVIKEIEI